MQALSSYVFIAANVILHASEVVQFRHLDELLPPIVPLLTSHHHSLRGFTQVSFCEADESSAPQNFREKILIYDESFIYFLVAVTSISSSLQAVSYIGFWSLSDNAFREKML
jgi:hypothetical protein